MQNTDSLLECKQALKIITIIFVYARTCVGDPGPPGKNGTPGDLGDAGPPGNDGE